MRVLVVEDEPRMALLLGRGLREAATRSTRRGAGPTGSGSKSSTAAPALGLAIVRAVAAGHGGTASAANRPGGGVQVVVRLPAPIL